MKKTVNISFLLFSHFNCGFSAMKHFESIHMIEEEKLFNSHTNDIVSITNVIPVVDKTLQKFHW